MSLILDRYPCCQQAHGVSVDVQGNVERWLLPRQCVLSGELVDATGLGLRTVAKALLDTGCDISMVKPSVIERLENSNGHVMLHVERRIFVEASNLKPLPAYDLSFITPQQDHIAHSGALLNSDYGFLVSDDDRFGDEDVWLGQDIFNQLVVTLDGMSGTVTIAYPLLGGG